MNSKFKNPYLWISIIGIIFGASGIDFNILTSWELLFEAVMSILKNPVSVVAVIVALLGVWNDNSTPGLDFLKRK